MTGEFPLLVILGPTASGKSALATAVARRCRAEILSVDSMQIYQGMDIGTAKPSLAERHEIRHHLIDWVRPDELFSVARFVDLADRTIADARKRGMPLIAVGGTPLYYQALFRGIFEGPAADESLRRRLRALTDPELHEQLRQIDPQSADRISPADRKRSIRALEVFELTGKTISSLQTQWDSTAPPRHPAVWIGLSWDRDQLNRRINARVKDMLEAGWTEEIRQLWMRYWPLSKTAAAAAGYQQLFDHYEGRVNLDEAVEQIKIATRQLARRQMKWFKRFPGVHWLPGDAPPQQNLQAVLNLWIPRSPRQTSPSSSSAQ
ncbi:MAG: tRNA (adenosine(37)-N6)-dimethylallyltransferase MiaA [Tepidisphaeraceae bacterium]|jgi:tRNA dimethylallyltransferase